MGAMDAAGEIAVQENHAGFVKGQSVGEGFHRVAGNAAKSGLLANAPAQSPANACIQFNHQHALPIGVDRQGIRCHTRRLSHQRVNRRIGPQYRVHTPLEAHNQLAGEMLEGAVPALLHCHLINLAGFGRSHFHVWRAEREKITHAGMINARGQILL